jgi:hypothetical protein
VGLWPLLQRLAVALAVVQARKPQFWSHRSCCPMCCMFPSAVAGLVALLAQPERLAQRQSCITGRLPPHRKELTHCCLWSAVAVGLLAAVQALRLRVSLERCRPSTAAADLTWLLSATRLSLLGKLAQRGVRLPLRALAVRSLFRRPASTAAAAQAAGQSERQALVAMAGQWPMQTARSRLASRLSLAARAARLEMLATLATLASTPA